MSKEDSREIFEFIELAEMSDVGRLPLAGGTLDQTASFFDAYGHYLRFVARLK